MVLGFRLIQDLKRLNCVQLSVSYMGIQGNGCSLYLGFKVNMHFTLRFKLMQVYENVHWIKRSINVSTMHVKSGKDICERVQSESVHGIQLSRLFKKIKDFNSAKILPNLSCLTALNTIVLREYGP